VKKEGGTRVNTSEWETKDPRQSQERGKLVYGDEGVEPAQFKGEDVLYPPSGRLEPYSAGRSLLLKEILERRGEKEGLALEEKAPTSSNKFQLSKGCPSSRG